MSDHSPTPENGPERRQPKRGYVPQSSSGDARVAMTFRLHPEVAALINAEYEELKASGERTTKDVIANRAFRKLLGRKHGGRATGA